MKKRNKTSCTLTNYKTLECRRLLAGDFTAVTSSDSLNLFGDNAANQILIDVTDDGDIEISGQNDTLINGSNQPFVVDLADSMLQDIRIFLAGGDDSVVLEDIQINGRVVVRGGGGDDAIGFLRAGIGENVFVDSGIGDDSVSVDQTQIGNNITIKTGGGTDTIGIDQSVVNGRTNVDSGARGDRIVVRDSIHNSRVKINSRGGADFVSAVGLTVNDVARINGGARSDNLFVNDTSFNSRLIARGAGGNDILEVSGESEFQVSPRVSSFEGSDVIGGLPQTDQAIGDLIEEGARLGTIVELAAMADDLSSLVGAVQATGLDTALSGSGPLTVFAPVNSAFGAISEVVAGLTNQQLTDVLLFHVVAGEVLANELVELESVETLLGQSFSVDTTDGVVLNGNATLGLTNIRAKNGVIHLLNDVLVPVL